ncbi:MAG: hypothetical protein QXL15_03280 [Candidatus Korarchaeota archaeon]
MSKIFGTSGVRSIYPHEKGPDFYNWLGKSIGTWIREKGEKSMIIGWDTRPSAEIVMNAFSAGLMESGISTIKAGIVPTPTVCFTAKRLDLYSAMVTASHNPPEYIGVKIISPDGRVLTGEEIDLPEPKKVSWSELGREEWQRDCAEHHIKCVLKYFRGKKRRKIVVDTRYGTGSVTTPHLLRRAGHLVVTLNSTLGGRLSPFKIEGKITNLIPTIKADLGIVHDIDADRVLFFDENGKYIEPVRILATLIKRLKIKTIVVVPIDTPTIIDKVAKSCDVKVIRTRVGDSYVSKMIHEFKDSCPNIIGGEGSGTYVWPDLHFGTETLRTIVELLNIMDEEESTLGALVSEFEPPKVESQKVKCPDEKKEKVMNIVKGKIREIFEGEINTIDGIYISKEQKWLLIRPSGTEPIIRITSENAGELLEAVRKLVENAVEKS